MVFPKKNKGGGRERGGGREEEEGPRRKAEGVRGLCEKEGEGGGGGRWTGGGLEGEEVNLHILKGAGFFIKKRLKLIYAGALLTHCTL